MLLRTSLTMRGTRTGYPLGVTVITRFSFLRFATSALRSHPTPR